MLFHNMADSLVCLSAGGEGVMVGTFNCSSMVPNYSLYVPDFPNMSNLSDYTFVGPDQSMKSSHDVVGMGETVLPHNVEQSMDHLVGMSCSVSDDRMELIHESMVGNDRVHLVLGHLHTTF